MAERRLWIVDSDDIGEMSKGVLYETKPIKDFLQPDPTSRFLLVATKGYGKTLLLRAKRDRLEREREGYHLMPENTLTDKPMGNVQVFSVKDVDRIKRDAAFWQTTWRFAITIAVAKFAKRKAPDLVDLDEHAFTSSELSQIFANQHLKTITDHFPLILGLSTNQYHKARRDFTTVIAPIYRNLHIPIAAFIDNVDQYFDIHLGATSDHVSGIGALSKDFWYTAQIGLASAIRDLHGHNKHIKIFASIRREAFQRLIHEEQMALQFHGSSVDITYGVEDLKHIFLQNLNAEPQDNLVQRTGEIFERFFGEKNCHMWHPHVGEREHIWDYILRHTLLRPRDLMSMGAGLSSIDPKLRGDHLSQTISDVSTTIARSYLNEITPHLSSEIDFDALFILIPSNVLTREQVMAISRIYNRNLFGCDVDTDSPDYVNVFCSLYTAGLLGYVTRKVGTNKTVQKFRQPGDMPFMVHNVLPPSDHYIIHPALDAMISLMSAEYSNGFDTLNIAGANRPWRDESSRKGVLQADVVGYARIMQDAAQALTFGLDFDRIVTRHCRRFDHYQITNGDRLTLIDQNVIKLREAIVEVARELRESDYRVQIRAGADFGVVVDNKDANGRGGLVGMSLRTAARLEELAEPDTMAVTGEFVAAAGDIDPSFEWQTVDGLECFGKVPRNDRCHNLAKSAEDPDLWKELSYIQLSRPPEVSPDSERQPSITVTVKKRKKKRTAK